MSHQPRSSWFSSRNRTSSTLRASISYSLTPDPLGLHVGLQDGRDAPPKQLLHVRVAVDRLSRTGQVHLAIGAPCVSEVHVEVLAGLDVPVDLGTDDPDLAHFSV